MRGKQMGRGKRKQERRGKDGSGGYVEGFHSGRRRTAPRPGGLERSASENLFRPLLVTISPTASTYSPLEVPPGTAYGRYPGPSGARAARLVRAPPRLRLFHHITGR
jgi:hypothetical protein